jgi:glutathione synthase/RimK-type ligase-like ATP-grasp enzyme
MKKLFLYAYNQGSKGAKALVDALNIKRIKHERSKFKGNNNKVVINWGSSQIPPEVGKCFILNAAAGIASNKLATFEKLKDKPYCPQFWTKKDDVVFDKGTKIVCRTVLNGHSGKGIIISESKEQLADAPLYVKYIPKKEEYRVHVVNGEIIHLQRKARKKDVPDDQINWLVRNHDNGFIFQQEGFVAPDPVRDCAVDAVASLGLDFGAVDVIYNEKNNAAYVLEVNTAPGLEGTTIQKYAEAFAKVVG